MLLERAVVVAVREVIEIENRRCVGFLRPSFIIFCQMVGIVPYRLNAVCVGAVTPVIEVVLEKSRAALSKVSELHFLNVYLRHLLNAIAVYHDTEVRFVVKVSSKRCDKCHECDVDIMNPTY